MIWEPIVRTEAARDVMLAIDLSGSMDYRDFPDGPMDAVETLLTEIVIEAGGTAAP